MSLRESPILLLDCQTTGMHPSSGHLLEIAWSVFHCTQTTPAEITTLLVKLPEGEKIPRRISEITGISEKDLALAIEPAEVLRRLKEVCAGLGSQPLAVIHYATFETSFLKNLFAKHGETSLPFEILCSYKMAQRLFPQLPSRNIRGVAGFFGHRTGDFKRADCHVQATVEIWKGLSLELQNREITDLAAVHNWLLNAPKVKRTKYEYHITAERRLKLPKKPGVYRMLAKTGDVLYVGKATSLRDRVNSYFRGQKGRDPRKLEMLAQVFELDVTECETPLEAALLENDEIKRLNPPYNISLKVGRRRLLFYSKSFESVWTSQNEGHRLGPYSPMSSLEQLRLLWMSLQTGLPQPIFYIEIDPEVLAAGYALFLEEHGLAADSFTSLRDMVTFGMHLHRANKKAEALLAKELAEAGLEAETMPDTLAETEETDGLEAELAEELEDDVPPTPEEVAAKFGRLFARAAAELRRTKKLTRLLNARVEWQIREDQMRTLEFRDGRTVPQDAATLKDSVTPEKKSVQTPWRGLHIADYDRMSILLSGISRGPHRIG